jgi:hypothetical protein
MGQGGKAQAECGIRNLTAEVAEHAEVKTTKGSACKGKAGAIFNTFQKAKNTKKLSAKDLCVLRLLFLHPLVPCAQNPGKERA